MGLDYRDMSKNMEDLEYISISIFTVCDFIVCDFTVCNSYSM